MPALGGYSPYPRRFGGAGNNTGNRPRLRIVHESINAQRGTAFDTSDRTKVVWLENMAIARAITFDGWGTNQRLANQWDPDRMTDMLSRWEQILQLPFFPAASDATRRVAVKKRLQSVGQPALHSRLYDLLSTALGSVFFAIEYIGVALAVVNVPDGSYPFGTPNAVVPWSSSCAHILVRLQVPAGYSEADFYAAAGLVVPLLDPIVPAWVTIDWYRPGPLSTAITNGPSAAGFFLDDVHNLDNEIFDSGIPRIDSVVPNSGPAAGGTTVTISGWSLQFATVTIGGIPVTPSTNTDTTIVFVTPAHGVGVVVLQVAGPGGSTATAFTYT